MCCYSPRFSGTDGIFRAFLCLVRLNKLQLDLPSSSHYVSRGGESIYGAKMTPLPLCMSKALTPLSLTRRCNLTSTPLTGATKIYTHIYDGRICINVTCIHHFQPVFALIYSCCTLASKCSRRSQFAAAKSTALSVHLADFTVREVGRVVKVRVRPGLH